MHGEIDLSAYSVFPWYTEPRGVGSSIEAWTRHYQDLHVLKPDIDRFLASFENTLRSHLKSANSTGLHPTLMALRCDPLNPAVIERAQPRRLAVSEMSTVPGVRLPTFASAKSRK